MTFCANCDHAEDQHGLASCLVRWCECKRFEPGHGIPMPANADTDEGSGGLPA
jgi:hypothetical protein